MIASVEDLTSTGLMQRRRRASEIDIGAAQEASVKASLIEKDEVIAKLETALNAATNRAIAAEETKQIED